MVGMNSSVQCVLVYLCTCVLVYFCTCLLVCIIMIIRGPPTYTLTGSRSVDESRSGLSQTSLRDYVSVLSKTHVA